MPYIDKEKRPVLDGLIKTLHSHCSSAGDFNYIITKLLHTELERGPLSYSILSGVIGTLECAKLELYRMIAASYEDQKWEQNGHISDLDLLHPNDDSRGHLR